MIELVVVRDAGGKYGGEIFDPLLSSTEAAIQRGQFEIDFNSRKKDIDMEVEMVPSLRLGDQVYVFDTYAVSPAVGIANSISHVIDGATIYSRLSIETPL